jgi:sterol desaturase/sphingolipid hydroxylase (fatty acid hydroxylase superfamily)
MDTLNKLLDIDLNYIIIGFTVIFYSLELLLKNEFLFKNKSKHLLHNLGIGVVFFVGNIFWATFMIYSIDWLNNNQIGLFYIIDLPLWLSLLLSVVLFDFVNYWFHRAAHIVPVVWRFHRVHHSDTSMDVSTYYRSHPLEIMFWFGTSNILAVAIFGLSTLSLGLFFLVATPFFFLEHTNLKFPAWLDSTAGLIFTTPNIHKVHHEQDQYYTDSNYADIFILWDRLFGTYKYKPTAEIKFGLVEFDEDSKQTFWYLLKSPFININRVSSASIKEQNPLLPDQITLLSPENVQEKLVKD